MGFVRVTTTEQSFLQKVKSRRWPTISWARRPQPAISSPHGGAFILFCSRL